MTPASSTIPIDSASAVSLVSCASGVAGFPERKATTMTAAEAALISRDISSLRGHEGLTHADKNVLIQMLYSLRRKGSWALQETIAAIARRAGACRSAVVSAIRHAIALGIVTKRKTTRLRAIGSKVRRVNGANIYEFHLPCLEAEPAAGAEIEIVTEAFSRPTILTTSVSDSSLSSFHPRKEEGADNNNVDGGAAGEPPTAGPTHEGAHPCRRDVAAHVPRGLPGRSEAEPVGGTIPGQAGVTAEPLPERCGPHGSAMGDGLADHGAMRPPAAALGTGRERSIAPPPIAAEGEAAREALRAVATAPATVRRVIDNAAHQRAAQAPPAAAGDRQALLRQRWAERPRRTLAQICQDLRRRPGRQGDPP